MTDTGQQPERVEVTQADREEAVALYRWFWSSSDKPYARQAMRDGKNDADPIVRRIARFRHRLTALTEAGRAGVLDVERAFLAGWDQCWCRDLEAPTAMDGGRRAAVNKYLAAAPTPPVQERDNRAREVMNPKSGNINTPHDPSASLWNAPPAPSTPTPDVERMRLALEEVFDFLGGIDDAVEVRDKIISALSQEPRP